MEEDQSTKSAVCRLDNKEAKMLAQTEKTEDLRVRRTRMLIQKAFVELLEEKGFQSITIQDIADRAMVNRATFYAHFADKCALFEYSMREMFRQTLESKLSPDFTYCVSNFQSLISTVCDFLAHIDDHCAPVDKQGLPPFDEQITLLVNEALLKGFKSPNNPSQITSPELVADVASWAIYGAALHWSQQKHRTESAEEFAARTAPMIMALIH
jgi:AcrR family transcriptional regulator